MKFELKNFEGGIKASFMVKIFYKKIIKNWKKRIKNKFIVLKIWLEPPPHLDYFFEVVSFLPEIFQSRQFLKFFIQKCIDSLT